MAGITPDPKKRGCLLPPGCKDLHDVLRRHKQRQTGSAAPGKGWTSYSPDGQNPWDDYELVKGQCRLHELEKHVALVFASDTLIPSLTLGSSDPELSVSIQRAGDQTVDASLFVPMGTAQERTTRALFARQGWPLPVDGGWSPRLWPDLPVYQSYKVPLPPSAPEATGTITALFHALAGLTEQSELSFHYMAQRTSPDEQ